LRIILNENSPKVNEILLEESSDYRSKPIVQFNYARATITQLSDNPSVRVNLRSDQEVFVRIPGSDLGKSTHLLARVKTSKYVLEVGLSLFPCNCFPRKEAISPVSRFACLRRTSDLPSDIEKDCHLPLCPTSRVYIDLILCCHAAFL